MHGIVGAGRILMVFGILPDEDRDRRGGAHSQADTLCVLLPSAARHGPA